MCLPKCPSQGSTNYESSPEQRKCHGGKHEYIRNSRARTTIRLEAVCDLNKQLRTVCRTAYNNNCERNMVSDEGDRTRSYEVSRLDRRRTLQVSYNSTILNYLRWKQKTCKHTQRTICIHHHQWAKNSVVELHPSNVPSHADDNHWGWWSY